ncbi:MAG: hypothetical protein RSC68_03250 [Acinetobacter sp.]
MSRFVPRKSEMNKLSKKRYKTMRKSLSEIDMQRTVDRKVAVASLMKKVPLIGFSESRRRDIRVLLSAVDKRDDNGRLLLPEEIYWQQLQIVAGMLGLAVLISFVLRNPAGMMVCLIAPFAMGLVTSDLKEERRLTSKAISEEFLDFYRLYYVQFNRTDTASTLRTIVTSYMPRASIEFRRALGRFASDLESGEEFALANLDFRYPENMKIHKFCSIARARSKGDEAAYHSMNAFLAELEEQHDAFYEHELAHRQELLGHITFSYLIAVFAVIMGVLLFCMTKA